MATAVPSKGTEFWIEWGTSDTNSLMITPTAITKAQPAVVTCVASAALPNQVVYCLNTGFPELDGQYFLVGDDSTATSITLIGSNTTNSKGTLTVDVDEPPQIAVYVEGVDAFPLCVSTFSYDAGITQSVSVATFCDPTATIPGALSDASATFAGYTSPRDHGYRALLDSAHKQDKRIIYIRVPPAPGQPASATQSGVIVLEGTINSYKETYDIGQAISWTSGMVLTRASKQLWNAKIGAYTAPSSYGPSFGLPITNGDPLGDPPAPPPAARKAARVPQEAVPA